MLWFCACECVYIICCIVIYIVEYFFITKTLNSLLNLLPPLFLFHNYWEFSSLRKSTHYLFSVRKNASDIIIQILYNESSGIYLVGPTIDLKIRLLQNILILLITRGDRSSVQIKFYLRCPWEIVYKLCQARAGDHSVTWFLCKIAYACFI